MQDKIKVSVIVSTYNRKDILRKTIESILRQTEESIELIVCDDGSNDGTEEMVQEFVRADRRVRFIECGHNGRPAIPRNIGIGEAKGEWIAFSDDDDFWYPTKLEVQLNMLQDNGMNACCTNAFCFQDGVNTGKRYFSYDEKKVVEFADLLAENIVICSSMIIRRKAFEWIEGFPEEEELRAIEDYALWMRLATVTPILFCHYSLMEYSMNSGDSIRKQDVLSFEEQKQRAMNSLRKWLDNQPSKCKKNYVIGMDTYKIRVIKKKFICTSWDECKFLIKKVCNIFVK